MAALFENTAHDFPQRIIYRRDADGSLLARIEGGAERRGKEYRRRNPTDRLSDG